MQLVELATVRHRLSVQVPLPFNVRQADGTLLLARGQVLQSSDQMLSLFERGMLVDIAELQTPSERVMRAPAAQLPGLWGQSIERVGQALLAEPTQGFDAVIDEVSQPLVALVERDPDLAIFQVMRQHGNRHAQYGVNHSIHCAIAAVVSAQRLGWDAAAAQRAFKAALTMNLSMVELQGQMATQQSPLAPEQRELILTHPLRSVRMLQLAGIDDAEWLDGVAQHHEVPDGSGYPAGLRAIAPLALLLRQCDMYTAKLSPRQSREAFAADVAARRLFAENPGNPVATVLIKEFGLYPPGTFVKLASGETGIVSRRGPSAHAPQVTLTANARGVALNEPVQRDTSKLGYGIVAVLGPDKSRPELTPEALMRLAYS